MSIRPTHFLAGSITLAFVSLFAACDSAEPPATRDPGEVVALELDVGELEFQGLMAGEDTGPLVIFLHGFPETSHEWRDQLSATGDAGYLAVAPDQRGYSPGATPAEVDAYQVPELVADVLDIADALGRDTFHIVGHDWGAVVAWAVASAAPERLHSLTTLSIPHLTPFNEQIADMESCQYGASFYFDLFAADDAESLLLSSDAAVLKTVYEGLPEQTKDYYLDLFSTEESLRGPLNYYRANTQDRMFTGATINTITVPTLFVWSDGDIAICEEAANDTEDHVSAPYRYEVIEGVGHWIVDEASARVTELVLEHVRKNSGSN